MCDRSSQCAYPVGLVLVMAGLIQGAPIQPLSGTNLLRGKPATFSLKPNYALTEGHDETDLTDGAFWQPGQDGFWTNRGTVGWQFGRKPAVLITFDLGGVRPIDAVSFDTASGSAQVTFPAAVVVYVSDDGEAWHHVTDLINEAIDQSSFLRHRFVSRNLETRGRHIALYIAKGGYFAFVDEIEVIQGRHSASAVSFDGPPVARKDLESDALRRAGGAVQKNATLYFIKTARDRLAAVNDENTAVPLKTLDRLQGLAVRRAQPEAVDYSRGLPYTDLDRKVCRAMGQYFAREAQDTVTVWPAANLWSTRTHPFARGPGPAPAELCVDMMIGEYEPVAFNVSNDSAEPQTVTVHLSDLKAANGASVLSANKVERRVTTHVLASGYLYFDDALTPIADGEVILPPGMTRQVWLIPHSRDVEPGRFTGTVTVTGGSKATKIRLSATVYPVEMPRNPSYTAQSWGYFTAPPARGHERKAAAELERSYANAHVLHHHYVPWPKVDPATKKLIRPVELDFSKLDEMLAYRPYVKQWLLWPGFEFGYMTLHYKGGIDMPKVGTSEHESLFKQWVRQIRDHMRAKGFPTDRWAFYWVDEPGDRKFESLVVPASKMAKQVDPTILVWEDHQVSLALLKKYPDAIDIHCCPLGYYRRHPDILTYVLAQKRASSHYVTSSEKKADPHQYYRLHHSATVELGLDGAGMWVWGDEGGQFNDYAGPFPSYGMVYATENGPITGKRREAWREGIEDVELWRHLRLAAEKRSDPKLVDLNEKIPRCFMQPGAYGQTGSPEDLMRTRREVLRALAEGG